MLEKMENREFISRNNDEKSILEQLKEFHLHHLDKWGANWNQHSLITLQRQSISRVLYYNELYQKIVGIPGCILEFGVQWGVTLSLLISFRGMYEPYNHRRHIYGFDTFEGFIHTDKTKDGSALDDGDYCVYPGYEYELEKLLKLQEQNCPVSHIQKAMFP